MTTSCDAANESFEIGKKCVHYRECIRVSFQPFLENPFHYTGQILSG